MRSLSMILMFSLGVLFSDASLVQAHNDTFFNSPHKLELKPANSEPAYRLAKSYWLGGADIGLSFGGDDGSTICRAQGYTSDSCIPPLSIIKTCSYNGNYHLCGCDSSVYKYSSQECPTDAEPDGNDTCDGYSRACEAPNCANGGVKCGDGQTCNTATKLCENTARSCQVGDTLYSDIHCYEGVPADKKAIAVVFDTTENLAVSLEEQEKTWGGNDIDIPSLGNCLRSTIDSCRPASGKESTANILSYGRMYNISYPAAEYCNNYSTQGTTTGDWWLPSGSELMRMRTNYEIINETLTKLNAAITVWYDYWSSSEQSRGSAISLHIGNDAVASNRKIIEKYVRCVLAY